MDQQKNIPECSRTSENCPMDSDDRISRKRKHPDQITHLMDRTKRKLTYDEDEFEKKKRIDSESESDFESNSCMDISTQDVCSFGDFDEESSSFEAQFTETNDMEFDCMPSTSKGHTVTDETPMDVENNNSPCQPFNRDQPSTSSNSTNSQNRRNIFTPDYTYLN